MLDQDEDTERQCGGNRQFRDRAFHDSSPYAERRGRRSCIQQSVDALIQAVAGRRSQGLDQLVEFLCVHRSPANEDRSFSRP